MNLKMFFAFGCTIKVFFNIMVVQYVYAAKRKKQQSFAYNTRSAQRSSGRVHFISIGLIGIYNKEELIVLFAWMYTHTHIHSKWRVYLEKNFAGRWYSLVLRAIQAFLWNTSSQNETKNWCKNWQSVHKESNNKRINTL